VRELPTPEPAEDELRVRVHAASINAVDALITRGALRGMMEYDFPVIPGRDFSGVVESVGPAVASFSPADEVLGWFTFPVLHTGSWAEYVVIAESRFVAHKPESLDFVQAAALPLGATTAHGTVEAVTAAPGSRVLIVGAGGGVGGYAVQLAAMRGANVIATARPGDEARLRELGAAETVDFTAADVASTVRDRHPEGIDGLIDLVSYSPDQMAPLAALVRDGGAIASPLGAAGAPGRDLVATNVMADALDPAVLKELAALAGAGDLRIPVEAIFPLEEAAAAVDAFTSGKRGKIVLAVAAG
jgi:NADPH:quinone reductase-like Zn-dependent oxidoreductase